VPPVLSPRLRGDCRLKDNASRALRNDDPFDLYDWLLNAYAKMTQEQVDKFFERHPTVAHYKGLPLKQARIRVAREYTKSMWMRSQHDKAAGLFQDHPHITVFPGDGIDVMPVVTGPPED
jgi:hypothetical protein